MTKDEIFTGFAKAAIDKYPTITGRCQECPIRFIEYNVFSKNKIYNEYEYLNKDAEYGGSTCFLIAQKIQLLKIAKVNGIFFNNANTGYIDCFNICHKNKQKIKITKLYDFNKI